MHNKSAQLRFKALLAAFILSAARHPTVSIHPILFYYEASIFLSKMSSCLL